ncbi:MAG TPA: Imm26 family immunity protein [Phycisphaerales bacterium]|nr:Imm26 family immunity protein [Phycisphaerales bacterium]
MASRSRTEFQPKYLRKIKPTRGVRPVGEVFAMAFGDVGYLFGRVIRNDCAVDAMSTPRPWERSPGCYLVYIYRTPSPKMEAVPPLRRADLLIAPAMIIGAGWSRGYFAPVRQDTLAAEDVLPVHCFWNDTQLVNGKPAVQYVDEYGNLLRRKVEPCGEHGVGSFGSVEIDVARALGLPYEDA